MKAADKKKKRCIVLAVGGTGGHLFPAQSVARDIQKEIPEAELFFMGSGLSTSRYFYAKEFTGIDIASGNIRGKKRGNFIYALYKISRGIIQSIRYLQRTRPELVVGFGSFHAFPVLVGAFCCRIPMVLFESNAIPGRVIRWFSYVAKITAIHFPSAEKHLGGLTREVSMPIWDRDYLSQLTREEAAKYFSLRSDVTTLLVFGGSQGSMFINEVFCQALNLWKERPFFQVIHLTGNIESCHEALLMYRRLGIPAYVKAFEERMPLAFRLADLAICRAGASTVAELLFFGVPALLIPYPHATENHQVLNAQFFVEKAQGGNILEEKELQAATLIDQLEELLKHRGAALFEKRKMIETFQIQAGRGSLVELVKEVWHSK